MDFYSIKTGIYFTLSLDQDETDPNKKQIKILFREEKGECDSDTPEIVFFKSWGNYLVDSTIEAQITEKGANLTVSQDDAIYRVGSLDGFCKGSVSKDCVFSSLADKNGVSLSIGWKPTGRAEQALWQQTFKFPKRPFLIPALREKGDRTYCK